MVTMYLWLTPCGLGLIYRDNKDFHLDVRASVVIRQGNQGEQKGPPWLIVSLAVDQPLP